MNYGQRFNEEFQKALEAKEFPAEKLSCNWISYAITALRFASLIALGINPEDWKKLLDIEDTRQLSLYQFALLSNNLQARTPKDLSMSVYDYHNLMQDADSYVKIWQELSNDLRAEVETRLNEEKQMLEAAAGKPKLFNPLKAEA